jgi:hypothetical protein
MRHEDHSIETDGLQEDANNYIFPCVRSEKCGGEELKNAFDMIPEQGYKLVLQVFPSPRQSVVWSFCMRITLERLNKTSGLAADRLGEASALWPNRANAHFPARFQKASIPTELTFSSQTCVTAVTDRQSAPMQQYST